MNENRIQSPGKRIVGSSKCFKVKEKHRISDALKLNTKHNANNDALCCCFYFDNFVLFQMFNKRSVNKRKNVSLIKSIGGRTVYTIDKSHPMRTHEEIQRIVTNNEQQSSKMNGNFSRVRRTSSILVVAFNFMGIAFEMPCTILLN